jgi:pimeloyl-ACP methyl ester carboxylesterase
MPKSKMHDLVVVLPGITGSVLKKDDRDLWAISGSSLWSALTSMGRSLGDLVVPDHDPRCTPPESAIRATQLIQDFHGIFGFWRIDGYTSTIRAIADMFDVRIGKPDSQDPGVNLIPFPYDWRLSNRFSAEQLKRVIDQRLPAYQKISRNPKAKVVLIAHSMGGLVARYYLEVLRGFESIRALITFGTPYRGAVAALGYLANGYKKSLFGNTLLDLSNVVRSLPSAYELLPRYKALKVGSDWKRPAEVVGNLPGLNATYTEAGLDFHLEIDAAIKANKSDPQYTGYPIFPVVGIRQSTPTAAILDDGRLVVNDATPDWLDPELGGGDGTVPRVSATPHDREGDLREVFFGERHASLQRNDYILTDLVSRLEQLQAPRRLPARGGVAAPHTAISLSMDELYGPGEPIEISADAIEVGRFCDLRALVVGATGSIQQTFHFASQGQKWVANVDPLPPGQYRVSVDVANGGVGAPKPVHDVFEVAG